MLSAPKVCSRASSEIVELPTVSLDNKVACFCLNAFAAKFRCAELSRDFGLGKTIKIVRQQVWERPYSRSGANDPKYDESAMAWITAVVAFLEPETIR